MVPKYGHSGVRVLANWSGAFFGIHVKTSFVVNQNDSMILQFSSNFWKVSDVFPLCCMYEKENLQGIIFPSLWLISLL